MIYEDAAPYGVLPPCKLLHTCHSIKLLHTCHSVCLLPSCFETGHKKGKMQKNVKMTQEEEMEKTMKEVDNRETAR